MIKKVSAIYDFFQTANAIDFLKLKVYIYVYLISRQTGFGQYIQYIFYSMLFNGVKISVHIQKISFQSQ